MPELAQGALRLAEVESGFEAAEAFLHGAHSQKLPLHYFDDLADLFGSWIGCNGGRDVPSTGCAGASSKVPTLYQNCGAEGSRSTR